MTIDLIARQLQRETEASELAVKRMRDARREANERSYASSNIESRKAIAQFVDPIASTITKRYGKLCPAGPAWMGPPSSTTSRGPTPTPWP